MGCLLIQEKQEAEEPEQTKNEIGVWGSLEHLARFVMGKASILFNTGLL